MGQRGTVWGFCAVGPEGMSIRTETHIVIYHNINNLADSWNIDPVMYNQNIVERYNFTDDLVFPSTRQIKSSDCYTSSSNCQVAQFCLFVREVSGSMLVLVCNFCYLFHLLYEFGV